MPPTIRITAVCAFFRDDHLFVLADVNPAKQQGYFRLIGGEIRFGEAGRDAIARIIREEIGAEITQRYRIEMLENIDPHGNEPGHEIVQVFTAQFTDPLFNELDVVFGQHPDGTPIRACWKPFADFIEGRDTLYPAGLLKLLLDWREMLGVLTDGAE